MKYLPVFSIILASLPLAGAQESSSSAQVPQVELPAGPLLKRASDVAQWVITHKAEGGLKDEKGNLKPASADARDFRAGVKKSKNIYQVEIGTGEKDRVDKWCLGDLQITKMPNAQFPVISTAEEPDPFHMNFSRTDFPGFEWISPKNFVEVREVGGVACMIFRDRLTVSPELSLEAEAAINLETRLPVSLQLGEGLTTFRHETPSFATLTPPADVTALAKQWHERLRRASLLPPP